MRGNKKSADKKAMVKSSKMASKPAKIGTTSAGAKSKMKSRGMKGC